MSEYMLKKTDYIMLSKYKRLIMVLIVVMFTTGLAFASGGKNQGTTGQGTTSTGTTSQGAGTQSQTGK